MSWNAYLHTTGTRTCPACSHVLDQTTRMVGSWNYTHNTNRMIAGAYEAVSGEQTPEPGGPLGRIIGAAWWDRLDDAGGYDGRAYLDQIIKGPTADPERFRAMNPDNGWGDYDSLLDVLREMRNAVPDEPSMWSVSG